MGNAELNISHQHGTFWWSSSEAALRLFGFRRDTWQTSSPGTGSCMTGSWGWNHSSHSSFRKKSFLKLIWQELYKRWGHYGSIHKLTAGKIGSKLSPYLHHQAEHLHLTLDVTMFYKDIQRLAGSYLLFWKNCWSFCFLHIQSTTLLGWFRSLMNLSTWST